MKRGWIWMALVMCLVCASACAEDEGTSTAEATYEDLSEHELPLTLPPTDEQEGELPLTLPDTEEGQTDEDEPLMNRGAAGPAGGGGDGRLILAYRTSLRSALHLDTGDARADRDATSTQTGVIPLVLDPATGQVAGAGQVSTVASSRLTAYEDGMLKAAMQGQTAGTGGSRPLYARGWLDESGRQLWRVRVYTGMTGTDFHETGQVDGRPVTAQYEDVTSVDEEFAGVPIDGAWHAHPTASAGLGHTRVTQDSAIRVVGQPAPGRARGRRVGLFVPEEEEDQDRYQAHSLADSLGIPRPFDRREVAGELASQMAALNAEIEEEEASGDLDPEEAAMLAKMKRFLNP